LPSCQYSKDHRCAMARFPTRTIITTNKKRIYRFKIL
jgi:hypothetical protein